MFDNGEPRFHDHESDPAHTPGDGWADEGGASHYGPATSHEAGHPHHEDSDDGGDDGEA